MRFICFMLLAAAILFGSLAAVAATATGKAGKFTVSLSSRPSPPNVGENLLIIVVKDGDKPLNGANIDVHIDMTSMPMPADAKATAGRNDGEYGAMLNFSMAGSWKVDVSVQQMAGMKMAGDGNASFLLDTGKGITAELGGVAIPWFIIFVILLLVATLLTIIFYRRIPLKQRGYIVGTLTLLIVLVGTVAVVKKYRDTKTSTVIASANMDMSTQAAPGTVAVETETAEAKAFQSSVKYTGSVIPDIEEDIYARVTGRLISMPFYPGDTIAAGDVVARLDSIELSAKEDQALFGNIKSQQDIAVANADKSSAEAGYAKALKGVELARAQLEQVQGEARAAASEVKAAQSEVIGAQQSSTEADSGVPAAQALIAQAHEAVIQEQSEVESAQADVDYWTAEIIREKKLFQQGAIAKEELDREVALAAAADAKLKQANARVRTADAGVSKAKQELMQAQARQAAAQAGIVTAQARQEQAQANYESQQGKIRAAKADIASAEAEVKVAVAGVTGANAKAQSAKTTARQTNAQLTEASTVRGYTTIRATSGGVVTARNISPGVLVQPGMSILKISKIDFVRIQINAAVADLAEIKMGQLVTAHSIEEPGRLISAYITAIFPTRDTSSRTAIVEARVANPGAKLKPGQYLAVQINLSDSAAAAITVPTSAIMTRDGESTIFIAESDGMQTIARRKAITTGRLGNERTEILAGITASDQVITAGIANLRDGDAVTVVRKDER